MINELNKLYNEGFVTKQTHPIYDLTIWNYKPLVQYERLWHTNPLLLQCRGLVTNSEGEIIARPFKKFFNYEEYLSVSCETIPNELFEVYEKMDGSLGILFHYKGSWILATRGSFTSEQAIKGYQILIDNYDVTELVEGYTYLFEIIYPENRIVVSYDKEMLVLLGCIETSTGEESDYKTLSWCQYFCGFPLVKKYDGISDYTLIKNLISDNREGVVIRFKSGFRMKIKGEEYCRLHRILTNISNRSIWEYLSENKPLDDIIEKVPDEFYDWVKITVRDLKYGFHSIKEYAGKLFDSLYESYNGELPIRKTYAEWVLMQEPHLRPILFKMYDKKDYDNIIWDQIYPSYSKPFKNENNED